MAKKRGGLAGLWDRSKNVIAPVLAGAAGIASGGLLAPIAVGALSRGLDREGRGGIGFDVGRGLGGATEGAAFGGLGRGLAGLARGAGAAGTAALPTAAGSAPLSVRDLLSQGVDWAKSDPRNLLSLAQGGFNAYNSAQAMGQQRKATRGMEREWAAGAPLRAVSRDTLLRGVEGNPFAPVRVG